MKPKQHIPGRPSSPQPPQLAAIADAISHPAVMRSGITTTTTGEWALLVVVKDGTSYPIPAIQALCGNFPVIYQEVEGRMPIARPAYPGKGE